MYFSLLTSLKAQLTLSIQIFKGLAVSFPTDWVGWGGILKKTNKKGRKELDRMLTEELEAYTVTTGDKGS